MMPAIARRISRQLSPEGAELPAGSVSVGGRVTFGVPVAPPTPPSGVGVGVGSATGQASMVNSTSSVTTSPATRPTAV